MMATHFPLSSSSTASSTIRGSPDHQRPNTVGRGFMDATHPKSMR